MQNFTSLGPPLSITDIHQMESRLKYDFPIDYINFLMRFNGGRPDDDLYRIVGRPHDDVGLVQLFFGIGRHPHASNIAWNFDVFAGRIPKTLIPIGREDGGNLICFSRKNNAIYYWDHHAEGRIFKQSTFLLASGWQEFLDGLYAESAL